MARTKAAHGLAQRTAFAKQPFDISIMDTGFKGSDGRQGTVWKFFSQGGNQ